MDRLDSETEELLKEILENDDNFPEYLINKFNGLSVEENFKLRAKIKVLSNGHYISLIWADNLPYLGSIEQKGQSYFASKEQEETKGFNAWEKLLYKLLKNVQAGREYLLFTIKPTDDERITMQKLQELGYINNLKGYGIDNLSYTLTYDGLHYFENRNSLTTQQSIEQKKRVFISHSSKDETFVVKFVQLIQLLGVERGNIFCSSIEGQGVNHGMKIEEAVRNELIEDKVIIYILSNNFFNSTYCINELGAGWILSDKRIQDKNLFLIKLPDVSFDDIKGFIGGSDKYTECTDISITAFIEEFENVLELNHKQPTEYLGLVKNFIKDIEKI